MRKRRGQRQPRGSMCRTQAWATLIEVAAKGALRGPMDESASASWNVRWQSHIFDLAHANFNQLGAYDAQRASPPRNSFGGLGQPDRPLVVDRSGGFLTKEERTGFMSDLFWLLRPPYIFLILGVISIFAKATAIQSFRFLFDLKTLVPA
jgi:hypothetical protein